MRLTMFGKSLRTTSVKILNRTVLVIATLIAIGFGSVPLVAQQSSEIPATAGKKITLEEKLKAGLRATTKCDMDFIDIVVEQVKMGKLPLKLVDSTFLWARDRVARKPKNRRPRPMIYFRPAMVLRAKRVGVILPSKCPAKPPATT